MRPSKVTNHDGDGYSYTSVRPPMAWSSLVHCSSTQWTTRTSKSRAAIVSYNPVITKIMSLFTSDRQSTRPIGRQTCRQWTLVARPPVSCTVLASTESTRASAANYSKAADTRYVPGATGPPRRRSMSMLVMCSDGSVTGLVLHRQLWLPSPHRQRRQWRHRPKMNWLRPSAHIARSNIHEGVVP